MGFDYFTKVVKVIVGIVRIRIILVFGGFSRLRIHRIFKILGILGILGILESLESWEFKFADSKAVLIDSSVALIISPKLKRSFIGLRVRHDSSVLQRLAFDC